jgi:predicted RNA-binding Zn-ribbon protein involved in translation (DUF1610 family)
MKEPQFYCENCGNSVALKADRCPSCGRRFDAVKCPECGFSGKSGLFQDGCPSCGYLSSLTSISSGSRLGIAEVNPNLDLDALDAGISRENKRAMPAWAYTVIAIGLIGFLVFLLITYLTLD